MVSVPAGLTIGSAGCGDQRRVASHRVSYSCSVFGDDLGEVSEQSGSAKLGLMPE